MQEDEGESVVADDGSYTAAAGPRLAGLSILGEGVRLAHQAAGGAAGQQAVVHQHGLAEKEAAMVALDKVRLLSVTREL